MLVDLEVGLSAICLMAAGLLLHSFDRLMKVDIGFDAGRVVTVDISLPARRYPTIDARVNFVRALVDGTQQLPGATAAGVSNKLPLSGEGGNALLSSDGSTLRREQHALANVRFVNPDYLRTMGIPLHTGRLFAETDRGRPVAVVSALTADRLWPHENALGKRFRYGPDTNPPIEVLGVAGDVRGVSLDRQPSLTIYVPYWQIAIPPLRSFDVSLAVRGTADPLALSAGIRDVVHRLDPEVPLPGFRTMDAVIGESVGRRRFQTTLVLLFACAATLLASLGVYGVVSYAVAQRTREIGIRLALGARPAQIHRLVLAQSLVPIAIGLIAGLLIAMLALNRVLGALLFGIQATDPMTLAAVIALILTVAVIATHLPARRATQVDPLRSLRSE